MKITLVGMGSGLPGSLTAQGLQALQTAGLILGAKRLLQNLPDGCTPNRKPIYQPEEVLDCLQAEPCQTAARGYRLLFRCCSAGAQAAGTGGGSNGAAGGFQRTAVGRGAGQAVAELAPCQRPRMCLRPCGRVPERPPDLFFDGRAQYQPRRAV